MVPACESSVTLCSAQVVDFKEAQGLEEYTVLIKPRFGSMNFLLLVVRR